MAVRFSVEESYECRYDRHGACDGYTGTADFCECDCHTEASAAPYDFGQPR